MALATLQAYAATSTSTTYLRYRTYGSTGDGHTLGVSKDNDNYMSFNSIPVITDSSQRIEIWSSQSGDAEAAVYTNGYYFPGGA